MPLRLGNETHIKSGYSKKGGLYVKEPPHMLLLIIASDEPVMIQNQTYQL